MIKIKTDKLTGVVTLKVKGITPTNREIELLMKKYPHHIQLDPFGPSFIGDEGTPPY